MAGIITIDGSQGEGGGQVLRSSLALSVLEVPCCAGLVWVAEAAQQLAGRAVPIEEIVITIHRQRTGFGR
jgi:hypothetical protein